MMIEQCSLDAAIAITVYLITHEMNQPLDIPVNSAKDHPVELNPRSIVTLIVFTRYPTPGETKTRLIPALGAEGAATLQRQMTEHTLKTAQTLVEEAPNTQVDIRFSGSSKRQMQQWLGHQWTYNAQGKGDLGDRLVRAFQSAFEQGAESAIAIGIDCPGITSPLLHTALRELHTHDLVLGPATDGGYYLIGLSKVTPGLFQSIEWGTDRVLQQTLTHASRLNLKTTQLAPLADVDRPADLGIWEAVANPSTAQSSKSATSEIKQSSSEPSHSESNSTQSTFLSVIVPVLNEVEQVDRLLHHVQETQTFISESLDKIEFIVVDGGSHDSTLDKLRDDSLKVLQSSPGKATQMNTGARVAKGEVLLFLHADTQLPRDFMQCIHNTLGQPSTVAGAFSLLIDGSHWGLRVVEWGIHWRSRLFGLPYGDQGLFLRKKTFEQIGGFPDLPIMEDYEIVQRLKKHGHVAIAPSSVTTSSRRWQQLGILKTTLLNQVILIGYHVGISPQRLNNWYRRKAPKFE